MQKIWMVITNGGDGANGIQWVKDPAVIDRMEDLVYSGRAECYMSGDGLQARELKFPDDFDVDAWLKSNREGWTTLKDLEGYDDN